MNKGKVFIILTPGFPSSETDSTCLPMQQEFVKAMCVLHPHIQIIVLSFQYPFRRETYKWFDATVISFNGRNKGGLTKIFLRKRIYAELGKLYKDRQIAGLLSFWFGECAFIGKKFADKHGLIHYSWLMGQDAKANNRYFKKIPVTDYDLIALSDSLLQECETNYRVRPFAVISPGIEATNFQEGTRDIDLLAAGSLIPLKQFEIFVACVEKISRCFPEVKAVLVGEGPEKPRLLQLVKEKGLEKHILFSGSIAHAQLLALMRRTKVLLHPSSYEGYSGVCQEALGSGAHVISFCKAMNSDIPQWHIIETEQEMVQQAIDILTDKRVVYKQVKFQPMAATVHQLMTHYL